MVGRADHCCGGQSSVAPIFFKKANERVVDTGLLLCFTADILQFLVNDKRCEGSASARDCVTVSYQMHNKALVWV